MQATTAVRERKQTFFVIKVGSKKNGYIFTNVPTIKQKGTMEFC